MFGDWHESNVDSENCEEDMKKNVRGNIDKFAWDPVIDSCKKVLQWEKYGKLDIFFMPVIEANVLYFRKCQEESKDSLGGP